MHHMPVNSSFYKAWKNGKEQRAVYMPSGRAATPGMLQLLKRKINEKYHRA